MHEKSCLHSYSLRALTNLFSLGKTSIFLCQCSTPEETTHVPLSPEPLSLDQQEEVCASPKFKKALMQRYLNNSFETPPHYASGGDARPPSTLTPFTPLKEDKNLSQGHHKSSELLKSNPVTSNTLPLCTSSPKESFQARWNTSFQHVKVTKFPAMTTRFLDKTEVRFKPFAGRVQGEEDGKVIRKYERQRSQDNSSTNFKRQKTDRDPFQSSSPSGSSSLPLDPRETATEGWKTLSSTSTAQFQPSSWMGRRPFIDVRFSGESGDLMRLNVLYAFCFMV